MRLLARAEWGARSWQKRAPLRAPVPTRGWAVHHNGPWVRTNGAYDEIAVMRAIQRYHQDTQGWSDIAYSFAVGQSGTVFEARGWTWDQFANGSDSVAPYTEHGDTEWFSVLALIGWDPETGIQQEPTVELLGALDELRDLSISLGFAGLEVAPHRAWQNKPCPGETLTAWCHARNHRPTPSFQPTPPATPPTAPAHPGARRRRNREDPDDMIRQPKRRPGRDDTLDFTWLPENGRAWDHEITSCVLAVRAALPAAEGGPTECTVYFDGEPMRVELEPNSRPTLIAVPRPGLCSIVGHNVDAEVREFSH